MAKGQMRLAFESKIFASIKREFGNNDFSMTQAKELFNKEEYKSLHKEYEHWLKYINLHGSARFSCSWEFTDYDRLLKIFKSLQKQGLITLTPKKNIYIYKVI